MNETLIRLPTSDLKSLAAALRADRVPMPPSIVSLKGLVANEHAADVSQSFERLSQQGFSALQAATLIDYVVAERTRALTVEDAVQLVTTGPEPGEVVNRDTSVVVRDLFTAACNSVVVIGYAVYQGQRVFQSLAERMCAQPSLNVRLFLDVQRAKSDTTAPEVLASRFAQRFKTNQWPPNKPLPQVYYYPRSLDLGSDKHSCLHAKCVVIDGKTVFISSANFTEAAHERNIEIGVLIESTTLADRITRHFDTMLAAGLLRPLLR